MSGGEYVGSVEETGVSMEKVCGDRDLLKGVDIDVGGGDVCGHGGMGEGCGGWGGGGGEGTDGTDETDGFGRGDTAEGGGGCVVTVRL